MRAMVLERPGAPLRSAELPAPEPDSGQVLVRVRVCGVCRTDVHVADGDLPGPKLPLVLGHQIVGTVEAVGEGTQGLSAGDRVGIPWLAWTCGVCRFCTSGRENLCERARFTGYNVDGGYAELAVADARYAFPIPAGYPDLQAAPLLCAGLVGYRCLRMTGDARVLGIYGFGGAAHIVTQVALHQGRRVFAFTRRATAPGGTVVCGEIHMSDIPSFPYETLWRERVVRSVANLTRADGIEFLELAPRVPVRTRVRALPLERANEALDALRAGKVRGSIALAVSAAGS